MTTFQMPNFSHPEPPGTEDAMELSSDLDRRMNQDDDIDLDLDLTEEQHQDLEDEFMVEDEQTHFDEDTVNDDLMADDGDAGDMAGDGASLQDEEIQDAELSVVDVEEETVVDNLVDDTIEAAQDMTELSDKPLVDHTDEQQDIFDDLEQPLDELKELEKEVKDGSLQGRQQFQGGESSNDQYFSIDSTAAIEENVPPDAKYALTNVHGEESNVETQGKSEQNEQVSHTNDISVQEPITETTRQSNGDTSAKSEIVPHAHYDTSEPIQIPNEGLAQETTAFNEERSSKPSTYLHPVVVVYQDSEMSLFPPIHQDHEDNQTFLLQNEDVAFDSMKELLRACRAVLGDSIGEQDELEISIDDLDLHISEFSAESPNISLAELIDIYVRLQHFDGIHDPPPLYTNLYTKTRFSYRLDFLLNAVHEGKGLSLVRPVSEVDDQGSQGDWAHDGQDGAANPGASTTHDTNDLEHSQVKNELGDTVAPVRDEHQQLHLERLINDTTDDSEVKTIEQDIQATNHGQGQLDGNVTLNTATDEQDRNDVLAVNSDAENKLHLPPSSGRNNPQLKDQVATDDGDFANDEDEESEPASSAGSSTIQGDVAATRTSQVPPVSLSKLPENPAEGPSQFTHGKADDMAKRFGYTVRNQGTLNDNPRDHVSHADIGDSQALAEGPSYLYQTDTRAEQEEVHSEGEFDDDPGELDDGQDVTGTDGLQSLVGANDDGGNAMLPPTEKISQNVEDNLVGREPSEYEAPQDDLASEKEVQYDVDEFLYEEVQDDLDRFDDEKLTQDAPRDSYDASNDQEDKDPPPIKLADVLEPFEEDEEIAFEDEDEDAQAPITSDPEHKTQPSPESLKRSRSQVDDDGTLEDTSQELKRVRS